MEGGLEKLMMQPGGEVRRGFAKPRAGALVREEEGQGEGRAWAWTFGGGHS